MQKTRPYGAWYCVVLGTAVFLSNDVSAEQPTTPQGPAQVRLLTLNCQFLPGLAAAINDRGGAEAVIYRVRTLGQLLSEGGYSVIALNEVFDRQARRELTRHLNHRFEVITPPVTDQSGFGIDSGLFLAVDRSMKILEWKTAAYNNDSNPWTYGVRADGFARKGLIFAKVGYPGGKHPGVFMQIAVTHLEARVASIRADQWRILSRFLAQNADANHPVMLLGDLNTKGRPAAQKDPNSPYRQMMAVLSEGRPNSPFVDVWPLLSTLPGGTKDQQSEDGGERIDYILVSNPSTGASTLTPSTVRVNRFPDDRLISLSDHSGVEAEMQWVIGPGRTSSAPPPSGTDNL